MSRLRVAALVSACSLALHQLRWMLAPGAADPSHGYIPILGAIAGVLTVFAAAELLDRVAEARRSGRGEHFALSFRAAWLLAAVALFAIFSVQELFEGAVTSGFWLGAPLAVAFGALVAMALAGATAIVAAAARGLRRPRRRAPGFMRPAPHFAHSPGVLATHLAGRAPPSPR